MTAQHGTPQPSRSRRAPRGASGRRSGGGRGRRRPLRWFLTALAVVVLAGTAAVAWQRSGSAVSTDSADQKSDASLDGAHLDGGTGKSADIPRTGPGTFTTAQGQTGSVGHGRVLRYEVDVEKGLAESPADVAAQVQRILADPRGWTANGHSAFQRISHGTPDFVVRLATPGTVDAICGRYGLDTGGEVNCSVGKDVMVNLKRWLLATPVYAHDVASYRALIINHEVGHFLGHGHVGCPGKGKPAPVMMQQIKGMHGCAPNVWPYDRAGRYLTGPPV
ncbi:DUF3152 domain-containing protein [Streptomyces sp. NPDC051976]|uniref:DUF3152 domain-containing protein n=1 Tax=Streptomyces sp. NPDC051976 TaxID=3154947 RepID=UPI0034419CF8